MGKHLYTEISQKCSFNLERFVKNTVRNERIRGFWAIADPMEDVGFGPTTLRLKVAYSSQLS